MHTATNTPPRTSGTIPTIDVVRGAVNDRLAIFFDERTARAKGLSARYGELWSVFQTYANNRGKRVRPYLTVLAYSVYGGTEWEKIITVGAAQEMLSQALLIHDDIIDRDLVRYGKPNVAGLMAEEYQAIPGVTNDKALHLATSAALLVGDLAIAEAFALIRESGFSDRDVLELQNLLQEGIFAVAGGEFLDSETVRTTLETADPLVISRLKTALYSITVPLLSGAYLGGAPVGDMQLLRELGERIGIAYQLVDDLLSVFGDESVTGKTTVGDLREGKQTYLMQQTWMRATSDDRAKLQTHFGNPDLNEADAQMIRDIIVRSGAQDESRAKIEQLVAEAEERIQLLHISDDGKQALSAMCALVTKRNA